MRVPGRPFTAQPAPARVALPRPSLPRVSAAPAKPGCAGRAWLFESDDPEVINYALGVCSVCPVRDWCTQQAEVTEKVGLSLAGVWAGQVYGDLSYLPGRVVHEVV